MLIGEVRYQIFHCFDVSLKSIGDTIQSFETDR